MPQGEIQKLWTLADKNKDGQLDVDEMIRFFKKVNLNLPKAEVKSLTTQFGSKKIDASQFEKVYKQISVNHQLHALYKLTSGAETMSVSTFQAFLTGDQKHSTAEIKELVKRYATKDGKNVSFESFSAYFESVDGSAYHPYKSSLYMDMTKPLNEYYMNSSHNTYLTGDQLKSDSSVEAYASALLKGCRCVELDCWDGPKGEPVVYHGHTLTSKILFADVIRTVKENAFKASPYPVLLSLEVHCSVEQQKRMAEIMKQTLGSLLVLQPIKGKDLPSPQDLKNKILVKGKGKSALAEPFEESDNDNCEEEEETAQKPQQAPIAHKIADELADCAVYFKSKKFKNFPDAFTNFKLTNIASFSEMKALNLMKKNYSDFVQFNNVSFSRIYPKGTRVDSSNIDPLIYWQGGAQLAALNFQNFDKGVQLNSAMFFRNGRSGYILKPDYLRNSGKRVPNPKKLSIAIISAFKLPKPNNSTKGEIIDPFISCELNVPVFGKDDQMVKSETFKTDAITDNGFNPAWVKLTDLKHSKDLPKDSKTLKRQFSLEVEYPELSFLRFLVKDEDLTTDDFVAVGVIPIDALQQGYRYVPLWGHDGNLLETSHLFIYSSIN